MKACKKCKVPRSFGVDLSRLTRIFAIADISRVFIFLGPMLMVFFACTNLHPMRPRTFSNANKNQKALILYRANRTSPTELESEILSHVEHDCETAYKDNLPDIWPNAESILYKSLYLLGISCVLPLITAVSYLIFHKRERLAFVIGMLHLVAAAVAVVLAGFGVWYSFDERLCLLQGVSHTINVPACFFAGLVLYAILTKITTLVILNAFAKNKFETPKGGYHVPSPADELLAYLREMRLFDVKPHLKFDFPKDPSKLNWPAVEAIIKKILVDVRIQVAELHKDDPLVSNLLESGNLREGKKKRSTAIGEDGGGPSILKIVKTIVDQNSEYRLLQKAKLKDEEAEVGVILPEPELRSVNDY